jgi:hypothetical protein
VEAAHLQEEKRVTKQRLAREQRENIERENAAEAERWDRTTIGAIMKCFLLNDGLICVMLCRYAREQEVQQHEHTNTHIHSHAHTHTHTNTHK